VQKRATEVVHRLALTEDQIQKLPDNYEDAVRADVFPTGYDSADPQRPFLPADLFDPKGPWVCLGEQPISTPHSILAGCSTRLTVDSGSSEQAACEHSNEFGNLAHRSPLSA
jgi:hypothetical protein